MKNQTELIRNIDLKHVLTRVQATPDPHDRAKWHTCRGAISVNGQKFMNWSTGAGGGAIDLLMHLCTNAVSKPPYAGSGKTSQSPCRWPAWPPLFIAKGFEIQCGFDTDQTGDALADKMICRYPCIKRLRPIQHDWNDQLRSHPISF